VITDRYPTKGGMKVAESCFEGRVLGVCKIVVLRLDSMVSGALSKLRENTNKKELIDR